MKRIPLTQGKTALVSDQDYWVVRPFKWWVRRNRATGNSYAVSGSKGEMLMHRLIAGFPPFKLDHRNRNGLDNRRSNLRPATDFQNQGNSRISRNNTSGFKGVCWQPKRQGYLAQIQVAGKCINLGLFNTPERAHGEYMRAARKYFGKFARAA